MDIQKERSDPIDAVRIKNATCTITEHKTYIIFGNLTSHRAWISAHGKIPTRMLSSKTFNLPAAVGLQFYCKHGDTLSVSVAGIPNCPPDPSVRQGLFYAAGMRNVPDYILEKYQGRHGGMESYNRVARQAVAKGETIVTLRNRWFNDDLRLSTLVGWLAANMPNLNMVHGLHCRAANPPTGDYGVE